MIETPGFTRGAVSYVAVLDGKRVGFVGDLIYGNGKLLDLYSFQDAITVAQIRGYHGYGARLADLVTSLNRIIDANLDVAVPARGPIIHNPTELQRQSFANACSGDLPQLPVNQCAELVFQRGADADVRAPCAGARCRHRVDAVLQT